MRYVGIAAYSGPPPDHLKAAAEEFLHNLALCRSAEDTVVVTGGYWGLMKYVVDQALSIGFKVTIIPPLEMEDIRFPLKALVIRTGTSFRVRSIFLVRTVEVLVALGGAAGTMQEVVTAYTEGVPVFVLGMTGLPTDKLYSLSPYLDDRKRSEVKYFNDPKSLAQAVCKYLEETPPKGWAGL
ncbi:MAG: hypothetical protein J7J20_02025 [Desulfurococcales archaeon]|nr:hypothetical protein [Desulfurococcales archaeon]